jgi:hypothetical protein
MSVKVSFVRVGHSGEPNISADTLGVVKPWVSSQGKADELMTSSV